MKKKLIETIAQTLHAYQNCQTDPAKADWAGQHEQTLDDIARNLLPRGSGIDNGTKIDLDASTPEKIVLTFGFHHMDPNGYYCGWTDYRCIIRASLAYGLDIRITGRDRNQIKDYLYQTFEYVLTRDVVFDTAANKCNGGYVFVQRTEAAS